MSDTPLKKMWTVVRSWSEDGTFFESVRLFETQEEGRLYLLSLILAQFAEDDFDSSAHMEARRQALSLARAEKWEELETHYQACYQAELFDDSFHLNEQEVGYPKAPTLRFKKKLEELVERVQADEDWLAEQKKG